LSAAVTGNIEKLNGGIALWAWTWSEIQMAHGAVIAHSMLEQLDPTHTFCHVSVSTDKCLALLPSFFVSRVADYATEKQRAVQQF
jgi:hypothetical protein